MKLKSCFSLLLMLHARARCCAVYVNVPENVHKTLTLRRRAGQRRRGRLRMTDCKTQRRSWKHNSELRDSHEYTHKVWGERSFPRQHSSRFCKNKTDRTSSVVSYDSTHPTYLETIWVHSNVAKIWVVTHRGGKCYPGKSHGHQDTATLSAACRDE